MRSVAGVVLLSIALVLGFAVGEVRAEGWVSPDTSIDAEGVWASPQLAYDGDTSTFASDTSNRAGFGGYLDFDLNQAITCGRVRVNADFGYNIVDSVQIDVFKDGAWINVLDGAISDAAYTEVTFPAGQVSKARFRYHFLVNGYYFWLYEFSLYESPEFVIDPSAQTRPAVDIEQTTASLHGDIADDGGAPCNVRFEYGTDTNYGTQTPWTSSFVTGQTFGAVVTGLTNGVTYHYRVQARNGTGNIVYGQDVTFTTAPPQPESWVSPTGFIDPDGVWQNPQNAYDDEDASYARTYHNIFADNWGSYLYLTHTSLQSDWVRFKARKAGSIDAAEVSVLKDGQWTVVYQGDFADSEWTEVQFAQGLVSQGRVRFHVANSNEGLYWQLYEFDFHTAGLPRAAGWIPPTGNLNPEGKWVDIPKAYDGNLGTYASDESNRAGDGPYVYFTLDNPIHCGRVRVAADFGYGIVDSVQIDVLRNGAWTNVLTGAINDAQYSEIAFTPGDVSQARFRFHYTRSGFYFWLYEFAFYESPEIILPPNVSTQAASSVSSTTAILHGLLVDDGGAPVQYRFEYGPDQNYGSTTEWTGSLQSGHAFGASVSGLTNGLTYHFHAEARNSEGTIVSGSDLSFTTAPASPDVWLPPTGFVNPAPGWQDIPNAFDDETDTYARENHALFTTQWSDYLYFTIDPMNIAGVRFLAKADAYIDQAEVGVSADGIAWNTVYSGKFADEQWQKTAFDSVMTAEIRIRFHVNTTGVGEYWQLYEINVTGNRALAGPFANPEQYSTNAGQTLSVPKPGVLTNDTDPDGLPLTAVVVASPAQGTLALLPDGSFSYTPNAGFIGADTFTYLASNGTTNSNIVTATINVLGGSGAFTRFVPKDGAWTNQLRPTISADFLGATFDLTTLNVHLKKNVDQQSNVAFAGMSLASSATHFDLSPSYDLLEGRYAVDAQIGTTDGQAVAASWSFGIDLTPPTVSGLPTDLSTVQRRPQFAVTYADSLSGIAQVTVILDGQSVNQGLQIGPSSLQFQPDADLDLGTHVIAVTVLDAAGNSAVANCALTILDPNADITKPDLGNFSPAKGGFIGCDLDTPAQLTLEFGDSQSGINVGKVHLTLDGNDADVNSLKASATGLTYTLPSGFKEGSHTWAATIPDNAGNVAAFSSSFVVDNTPPQLLSLNPSGLDTLATVSSYTGLFDVGTGAPINWDTFSIKVNGIDYSPQTNHYGDSFELILSSPLTGAQQIQISVEDLAGNPMQIVKRHDPVLSHFGYESSPGTFTESGDATFGLPWTLGATYNLRVATGQGTSPSTFSISGFDPTWNVSFDLSHGDGYLYFSITNVSVVSSAPVPVTYTIQDTQGTTYSLSGSIGFFNSTPLLEIFISPDDNITSSPLAPIVGVVTSNVPLVSAILTINNGDPINLPIPASGPSEPPLPGTPPGPIFTSLIYNPATPLPLGPVNVTMVITDAMQNTATAQASFQVASFPSIQIGSVTPDSISNSAMPTLFFTVSNFSQDYPIAADQTTVSYLISNQLQSGVATAQIISPNEVNYSFQLPDPVVSGSIVSYTIHAQTTATTPDVATLSGSFTVDTVGPVVDSIAPPAGFIDAATNQFTFQITDAPAGVDSWEASLIEASTGRTIDSTSGYTDGVNTFTLSDGITLKDSTAYMLKIEAWDNAGNSSSNITVYMPGTSDSVPPNVTITPADGAALTRLQGSIFAVDSGTAVDCSQELVLLDGNKSLALTATQTTAYSVTQLFSLPPDTANGLHTITVSGISDVAGNVAQSKTVNFTLNYTAPPTPVIDSIDAGTDIITVSGPIPSATNALTGIEITSNDAVCATPIFDNTAKRFTCTVTRDVNISPSISSAFIDVNGVHGIPAVTDLHFNDGPSVQDVITPLPASVTNSVPPNSVPSDVNAVTAFWDFDPNDITGVSSAAKGWIPGTSKSAIHIVGSVFGASGACTLQVTGDLTLPETAISVPNFSVSVDTPGDGLKKNINIRIKDSRGHIATGMARSLYCDRKNPNPALLPSAVWALTGLADLESSGTTTDIANALSGNGTLEDSKESGVSRIIVKFPNKTIEFPSDLLDKDIPLTNIFGSFSANNDGDFVSLPPGSPLPNTTVDLTVIDGAGNSTDLTANFRNLPPIQPTSFEDHLFGRFGFTPEFLFTNEPYLVVPGDGQSRSVECNGGDAGGDGGLGLPGDPPPPPDQPPGPPQPVPTDVKIDVTGLGSKIAFNLPSSAVPPCALDNAPPGTNPPAGTSPPVQMTIIRPKTGIFTPTSRITRENIQEFLIDLQPEETFIGATRVLPRMEVVIDEHNVNTSAQANPQAINTSAEDQDQQVRYGAAVPVNDGFLIDNSSGRKRPDFASSGSSSNLRLVKFNPSFADLLAKHYGEIDYEKNRYLWNGGVPEVAIWATNNIRIWRDPAKSDSLLNNIPTNPLQMKYKAWDLSKNAELQDFNSLNGQFWIEFLPGYGETGSVAISTEAEFVTINVTGISDNNVGLRENDLCVPIGGHGSVNLSSGALQCAWTMLHTGSGIIPDIVAYYNSRDCSNSAIATYFHHNLEMRLVRSAQFLTLIDMDGRRVRFTPDTQITSSTDLTKVTWNPPPEKSDFSSIRVVKQKRYGFDHWYFVLVRPGSNMQYLFARDTGKLFEIRDAYDNFARLNYDEYGGTRGTLHSIVDNRGVYVLFNIAGKNLKVTDVMNRTCTLNAPAGKSGGEGSIDGPLGKCTFKLNPNGRIYSYNNELGATFVLNPDDNGDSQDARETCDVKPAINDANGNPIADPKAVESTNYGVVYAVRRRVGLQAPLADEIRTLSVGYDFANSKATVTQYQMAGDSQRQSKYEFNSLLNIWTSIQFSEQNADGAVTSTESVAQTPYPNTRLIGTSTNLLQKKSNFNYDTNTGLMLTSTDPDSVSFQTFYKFIQNNRTKGDNPFNYIQNIVDVDYMQDGKQQKVQYGYDDNGFRTSAQEMSGGTTVSLTTFSNFDPFGLPQHIDGPRTGNSRDLGIDTAGRVVRVTESGTDQGSFTTQYINDGLGQPRTIILNDQRVIRKWYDLQGHLTATQGPLLTNVEKAANPALQDGGIANWAYDYLGDCTNASDPDGRTVARAFDAIGRLQTVDDSTNGHMAYANFDQSGQPQKITLPPIKDGPNRDLILAYDMLGREVQRTLPGGASLRIVKTAYDDKAKTVTVTDPRGNQSIQTLKDSGRSDFAVAPMSQKVTYGYDGNGARNSSRIDGLGADQSEWDIHGLLHKREIDGIPSLTTTIDRDPDAAVSMVTMPGTITRQDLHDTLGRVYQRKAGSDIVQTIKFQSAGAIWIPATITDENKTETKINEWDGNYNITQWNSLVNTAQYVINRDFPTNTPQKNLIVQNITGGAAYFPSGMPLQFTDAAGNHIVPQYDGAKRQIGTLDQDGLGAITNYTPSGFVDNTVDDRGKMTNLFYDPLSGFVTARRMPDGKGITYSDFDANGNPQTVTYSSAMAVDGSVTDAQGNNLGDTFKYTYTYDDANRVFTVKDSLGHETKYEYYNSGQLHLVTDPDKRTIEYVYDPAGRIFTITEMPGNRKTVYEFNDDTRTTTISFPDGRMKETILDERGRLYKVTATGQGTLTYHYDANGDNDTLQDSLEKTISMEYDGAHRNVLTTLPGQQYYAQEFDSTGYVIARTNGNGVRVTYKNTMNGRPQFCYRQDLNPDTNQPFGDPAEFGSYTYDGYTPTSDGSIHWELDDAGRVAHVSGSGADVRYTYDHPLGLLTNKTYGGVNLSYKYDDAGYLHSISDTVTTLTYTSRTPDGRPKEANYSNGIGLSWDYESERFLKSMTYKKGDSVLYSFNAQIDPQTGWRECVTFQPTNEKFTYVPDSQRRLHIETRTPNGGAPTSTVYEYDDVSNFVSKSVDGKTDEYFYTDRHELDHINRADKGIIQFGYDHNGNCTSKNLTLPPPPATNPPTPAPTSPDEEFDYHWDFQNRLKCVEHKLAGVLAAKGEFNYDAFGWEMTDSTITRYTQTAQGAIASAEKRTYGYGLGGELLHESIPGIDRAYVNDSVDHPLWSPGSGGSPIFYLNDVNGSVYAITDNSGTLIDRQRFDAYGKTEQTTPAGALAPSQCANLLGYQGRTNFSDISLTYFRNRWYSSDVGRFISRDPMGMVNGPNVFGFCGGDPVNRSDPSGLYWVFFRNGSDQLDWVWNDESAFGVKQDEPTDGPSEQEIAIAENALPSGSHDLFRAIHAQIVGSYAKSSGDPNLSGLNPFPVVSLGGNYYIPKSLNYINGYLDFSKDNLELGGIGVQYIMQADQTARAFGMYNLSYGARNTLMPLNMIGSQYGFDITTMNFAKALIGYGATPAGQDAGETYAGYGVMATAAAVATYKLTRPYLEGVVTRLARTISERFSQSFVGEFAQDVIATANGAPLPSLRATTPEAAGAPRSIALGLTKHPDHSTGGLLGRFSGKTGGATWDEWQKLGLTAVDPGREFATAFEEATRNTPRIHFNLDGVGDLRAFLKQGKKGFYGKNFTAAEFRYIVNHPDVLAKTTFYGAGGAVQTTEEVLKAVGR